MPGVLVETSPGWYYTPVGTDVVVDLADFFMTVTFSSVTQLGCTTLDVYPAPLPGHCRPDTSWPALLRGQVLPIPR